MQNPSPFRQFWPKVIALVGLTLVLSACQASLLMNGGTGNLRLVFSVPQNTNVALPNAVAIAVYGTSTASSARFFSPDTRRISISITAADMPTINIEKRLTLSQTSLTIDIPGIPIGIRRNVTVSLFNGSDVLLAEGSSSFDVQAGRMSSTSISAVPRGAIGISNGVIDIPSAIGVYCFQTTVDIGIQGLILEDYGRTDPVYHFPTYPFIKVYDQNGQLIFQG